MMKSRVEDELRGVIIFKGNITVVSVSYPTRNKVNIFILGNKESLV